MNPHRRAFLGTVARGSIGAGVMLALDAPISPGVAAAVPSSSSAAAHDLSLRVNGVYHELRVEPRVTLLDALREHLRLTGAKKGCDRGQCGACTVLINGRRVNSCLTLAVMHAGDDITTVEGLAVDGKPGELQTAFLELDAFQCGFCTPGQLCSATAMIEEARHGAASVLSVELVQSRQTALQDAEIRERMSGNICRCGAYPNIVAAIAKVARARS
ncbi:MAG TPA: 2Fe-2S iron-sulfur cluster-binding protein [Rudaea sp.]|jgi:xanthine dehydrogenase YagT iron-sulfur-binding subunit